MAWNFDLLRTSDIGGNRQPWDLKELLVGLSTPWTVRGSGDGTANWEDIDQATPGNGTGSGGAYDVWVTTAKGSQAAANNNAGSGAWIRLREPGGVREFLFARQDTTGDSYDDNWRVSISLLGFTGGTPGHSTPPTATDAEHPCGNLTTFPSSFTSTSAVIWRLFYAAQDSAINGVYPWYMWAQAITTGVINFGMFYDALYEIVPGDAHPFVFYWHDGSNAWNWDYMDNDGNETENMESGWTYHNYGETGELFGRVACCNYRTDYTYPVAPGGMNPNQIDSKERDLPILWASGNRAFYKGFSYTVRWKALGTHTYPDTANLTEDNARIHIGDVLLPWEKNLSPVL